MPRQISRNPLPAAIFAVVAVLLVVAGLSQRSVSSLPTPTPTPAPAPSATMVVGVTPTAGRETEVLIEGIAGRPLYLNPLLAQFSAADRDLTTLLFSGLTKPGLNGGFVPDLAQRWEVSSDGLAYTFFLRTGVKWHDGTLFTSEDVSVTIGLIQQPDFPGMPGLAQFWKNVRVETPDAGTVRFRLSEPYAPFPEAASIGMLQAKRWASVKGRALASSALNDSPVGTGPFQLKEAGVDSLVLAADPDYYGDKPKLGEIVIRFYQDSQSLAVALKRGEVMAAARLRNEDVSTLAVNPEINRYTGPLSSLQVVFLNTKIPYFADRGTRQALLLALDRQRIIDRLAGGLGSVAHSPIFPGSWAFDASVRTYGADAAQAAVLLEKAGWKAGPDGMRQRDEVKFEFTLLTNDDPQRVGLAQEISRQWLAVGVKADVQALSVNALMREHLEPRRYEALLYGWTNLGYDPDPYELWHSSQGVGSGGNYSGLASPLVDEWLEDARKSTDQTERVRLYKEFQEYFAEQAPALLLYQPAYTYAANGKVKGIRAVPLGDASDRFRQVAEWSLAGSQ